MNPIVTGEFQTLAEIAITLTGFTGVIGVFRGTLTVSSKVREPRSSSRWSRLRV